MLALASSLLSSPVLAGGNGLAPGFERFVVFDGLSEPTAVVFASDGRVFVAEKRGIVKVYDSLSDPSPDVFADLRKQVMNHIDRGLVGLALDPDFPDSPWVYVLYSADADVDPARNAGRGWPPKWGSVPPTDADTCPDPPGANGNPGGCVISGRLSRLQAQGNQAVGPEVVLLQDWFQQYPSHSVGDLEFDADGWLWASGGEGASFHFPDLGQAGSDPPAPWPSDQFPDDPVGEGGALRSQDIETPGDAVGLSGALVRIDPGSGLAAPGNPLSAWNDANAQRLMAWGLRNPFRFAIDGAGGDVWIADVGWNEVEEIDRLPLPVSTPSNFGWPCFEGDVRRTGFDSSQVCRRMHGQSHTLPASPVAPYRAPHLLIRQNQTLGGCSASGDASPSGVAVYGGGPYPAAYDGAVFFTDFIRGCVWAIRDENGDGTPETLRDVLSEPFTAAQVDLTLGPQGDIFWVDIQGGRVERLRYGSNRSPNAAIELAEGTQAGGPTGRSVSFRGSGSFDPDGGALGFAWDLDGDGQYDDSSLPDPVASFASAGTTTVRLRVTDPQGASDTASIQITADANAPTASINTPGSGATWRVGQSISYSGSALDPQDGSLAGNRLFWTLRAHHCPPGGSCAVSEVWSNRTGLNASFVGPDLELPGYLELVLLARDSSSKVDQTSVFLVPETVTVTLVSVPPGRVLEVSGDASLSGSVAAPLVATVVRGSSVALAAPSPQTLGQRAWTWSSWSDGGNRSHTVVANQNLMRTAVFEDTSNEIFGDGFEGGVTTGWSRTVP